MEPLVFKCPACEQSLSVKSKGNVIPIDYTITCKYCSAKFKFVVQVISGPNLTDNQILDLLKPEED